MNYLRLILPRNFLLNKLVKYTNFDLKLLLPKELKTEVIVIEIARLKEWANIDTSAVPISNMNQNLVQALHGSLHKFSFIT